MIKHGTAVNEVLTDVCVLVRDGEGWAHGVVHEDVALTMIGIASEDPDDFEDMRGHWSRYRTPPVPERFPQSLVARCEMPNVSVARQASGWVLLDLQLRRLQTGGKFQSIERDSIYDMDTPGFERPESQRGWALPICLPPWWELEQGAALPSTWAAVLPRKAPLIRPRANRRVLYGEALFLDLAGRVARIVQGAEWKEKRPQSSGECYRWVVDCHRDWLMSPRPDLGGAAPRAQLHGSHEWLENLVEHQRTRAREQRRLVARPVPQLLEDQSPMGKEEVCEYFDYCRAVLDAGFSWAITAETHHSFHDAPGKLSRALVTAMENAGRQWLASKDHDGLNRRFAREAARRRMPLAWDLEVEGMEDVPGKLACDPQTPNDPLSGFEQALLASPHSVTFLYYDGYQLDCDEEFAFSLCSEYEDWQWMYGGCQDSV